MKIHKAGTRVSSVVMRSEDRPVLRVILPGGAGVVEIETGLTTHDGAPRVRIDVESNTDRFGVPPGGLVYAVENGDPGPGVVFLTGYQDNEGAHA